jgi:hypothetical protein
MTNPSLCSGNVKEKVETKIQTILKESSSSVDWALQLMSIEDSLLLSLTLSTALYLSTLPWQPMTVGMMGRQRSWL